MHFTGLHWPSLHFTGCLKMVRSLAYKHLQNLMAGFTLAANWGLQDRPYTLPSGGFARDRHKLSGNVQRVGNDIRKVSERQGNPLQ
ncbi:hypothetical protein GCM10027395_23830 [Giesbergeria sinuosa]